MATMTTKTASVWAIFQICVGIILFCITAYVAATGFNKIRQESKAIGANIRTVAESVASARETYCASADNLFSLSNDFVIVSGKLESVGAKFSGIGRSFDNFANAIKKVKILPHEGISDAGRNMSDIGTVLTDVSEALMRQNVAFAEFKAKGHPSTLEAMDRTTETLSDLAESLEHGEAVDKCCSYTAFFGIAVSLMFVMNGAILFLLGKQTKA